RASRASESLFDACVSFDRRSPRKFTVGLPGSTGGGSGLPAFGWKLFILAHASSNVPSTPKCSSDGTPFACACATTHARNCFAMSASSKWSRFLVNTVGAQTSSSAFSPTNHDVAIHAVASLGGRVIRANAYLSPQVKVPLSSRFAYASCGSFPPHTPLQLLWSRSSGAKPLRSAAEAAPHPAPTL